MSAPHLYLAFLVAAAAVAAAAQLLSRRAPFPYPVVLAVAGVVLGLVPGLPKPPLTADLILLAFVPGLVFEAALALDIRELRTVLLPVGLMATLGVVVTVAAVGAAVHLLFSLPWPSAFLVAAVVAATDPIAVVNILRRTSAPGRLAALLEGEALFNDGTGVAIFTAVLATVVSGSPSVTAAGARFVVLTAGGLVAGVGVGALTSLLVRSARQAEVEILLTLVAAYGAYLAGDLVHGSGVVAVVAAGIVVARFARPAGRLDGTEMLAFWTLLGFILNAVLFVLIGSGVPTSRLLALAPAVVGGWLAMLVARAPLAYGMTPGIPRRWRHLALWGGVRGGLGVALALTVATTPGTDPDVPVIAYGMVLLSLLVQGGAMGAAALARPGDR